MTEQQHPTDEELFALFNSAEGDGSSYEGWLVLYRAGVAEGIRQTTERADDEARGDLVPVRLVPVEVFTGSEESYGLSDAVSSWSDCNRAIGRIYRVDDLSQREPDETITVHVPRDQVAWFEKVWGSDD